MLRNARILVECVSLVMDESKACHFNRKDKVISLYYNNKFNKIILFLVDSDKNLLIDFKIFTVPQTVKTAEKEVNLFSIREGVLPILMSFRKTKTIIHLLNMQLALDMNDRSISVSTLNS